MHFTATLALWALALPVLALRLAAADATAIRLPPWYGDNAVLVAAERTKDNEPDLTLIYGWSRGTSRPKVRFSTWPKVPVEAGFDERARRNDPERRWVLTSSRLDFRSAQSLAPGMAFSLQVEPGSSPSEDSLTVTNLAVGQVWILAVNPELDRHHPEELTPLARQRVRVLVLEGNSWDAMKGQWLTGDRLATNAPAAFSGLPRAFANRLSDPRNSNGAKDPIGLVLVPSSFVRATLAKAVREPNRAGFLVGSTFLGANERRDPVLAAASDAALLANSDAQTGARARYERAEAEHLARLTELKREGRLGEPFGKDHQEWTRLLPLSGPRLSGDPNLVPFRATGLIWEVR